MKIKQLKDVKVGMQVVVTGIKEATIYTVEEISGFRVRLSYNSLVGRLDGGWIDYSVLQHPSKTQIEITRYNHEYH